MKIIINGKFLTQNVTGVQRYGRELCQELDKIVEPGYVQIAVPREAKDLPTYCNLEIVRIGRLRGKMWEQISLPIYARKKGKIVLNLCNVSPLLNPGISTILDMKVRATPQFFTKAFTFWYRLIFWNACNRAKKIITISDFSKKEIIKYYKIAPERIEVIPCAWQHYKRIDYNEKTLDKYQIEKDCYYFSMGSLEPNKNFKWIAEVARQNPGRLFVVSGAINQTVFADGLGFECPDNMKLLGYVSDEEAKTLMRDCKAFIFPTFYEGFGLPPLEAISAGAKRVIVSDTEVMHEIFGDAVEYVNPLSFEVDLNQYICKDDELVHVLENYSWTKSAELLYQVIQNACLNT